MYGVLLLVQAGSSFLPHLVILLHQVDASVASELFGSCDLDSSRPVRRAFVATQNKISSTRTGLELGSQAVA